VGGLAARSIDYVSADRTADGCDDCRDNSTPRLPVGLRRVKLPGARHFRIRRPVALRRARRAAAASHGHSLLLVAGWSVDARRPVAAPAGRALL
jgi:hypothetical protein